MAVFIYPPSRRPLVLVPLAKFAPGTFSPFYPGFFLSITYRVIQQLLLLLPPLNQLLRSGLRFCLLCFLSGRSVLVRPAQSFSLK